MHILIFFKISNGTKASFSITTVYLQNFIGSSMIYTFPEYKIHQVFYDFKRTVLLVLHVLAHKLQVVYTILNNIADYFLTVVWSFK